MKNLRRTMSTIVGAALLACGGGCEGAKEGPATAPAPPAQPLPFVAVCHTTCAQLEAIGSVHELAPPHEDSGAQVVIARASQRWYVAWGGRPENVTQVQRFTSEGAPEGATLRIEGTTPSALVANAQGDLTLLGWVPPAYGPAGTMHSVHRLSAELAPVGSAVLLRAPGLPIKGASALASGADVVLYDVEKRPLDRVREMQLNTLTAGSNAVVKDWRVPSSAEFSVVERGFGERVLIDASGGALRATKLADDGTVGVSASMMTLPMSAGEYYVVHSVRIGDAWWVGAHAAKHGSTKLRIVRVDPTTKTPMGAPIEIDWPSGSPQGLIDANGTLAVLGDLQPFATPSRTSFVPIDVEARGACRPGVVTATSLRAQYQTVRALRFDGGVAGAVIDAWGNAGERRVFFTRLSCGSGPT